MPAASTHGYAGAVASSKRSAPPPSTPPIHSAPQPAPALQSPARQRVRLVAALGILAAAALTAGFLGEALQDRRASQSNWRDNPRSEAPPPSEASETPEDPLAELEGEVEAAERSYHGAWASLESAAAQGLPPEQLEAYERRLLRLQPAATTATAPEPNSATAQGEAQGSNLGPVPASARDL